MLRIELDSAIELTQHSCKTTLPSTCACFRYVRPVQLKIRIPADIRVLRVGEGEVRGEVQSENCESGETTFKTLAMSQMNPVHYRTCYSRTSFNATEGVIK